VKQISLLNSPAVQQPDKQRPLPSNSIVLPLAQAASARLAMPTNKCFMGASSFVCRVMRY
jgi:hypothetical protein